MIAAHIDAVKAALDAELDTYDGAAPDDAAAPYAILHSDDGPEGVVMHDGRRVVRTWTVSTQHFGESPWSVRWAAEKAEAALLNKRLTVAGRRTTRVRRLSSQGMRTDDTVPGSRLFYTVTVWRFASTSD